ncbi:hypothetical protein ACI68E_004505 [Malassezia pachydermatis]|uniref:tRNA N(3)-methylcytidine methyltransferase n=1 Tax=Malassezia pachydermatis TaxID=77020 RepID=A0A0M9VMM4_9BASI|nr:hypothetical protein Malapachy_0293 [Malassezia pachydermatis]KOS12433.1 hypothetical protein Malapachy_0293 [Malassezia pachydermatis]
MSGAATLTPGDEARAIPGNTPAPSSPMPGASQDAQAILAQNRRVSTTFMVEKTQREASKNWDKFYKAHEDRFFKDRHWTDREFDELRQDAPDLVGAGDDAPVLLEVGCGVGNTVYPLLEKNEALRVHCCDFSPRAVGLVEKHPQYTPDRVNAFVYDLVRDRTDGVLASHLAQRPSWPPVSTLSLIFVLSAIPPHEHEAVLRSLVQALPVGATIVFRDYARADLAQLRFHTRKDAQWAEPSLLSDSHDWYRRGDHTMAYFFARDEVEQLVHRVGGLAGDVEEVVKTNTNRKTGAVMERRFIQARLRRVA